MMWHVLATTTNTLPPLGFGAPSHPSHVHQLLLYGLFFGVFAIVCLLWGSKSGGKVR